MKQLTRLSLAALALCGACQQTPKSDSNTTTTVQPSVFEPDQFTAPHPEKKPKELVSASGDKRSDEYYWLNERDNPAVKAYLEAENRYTDSVLLPVKGLQEKLFAELKARIKEDDSSVPYFKNGYWYIVRFETGKEYPIFTRKKGNLDAAEEMLVDVNELAKGQAYCQLGGLSVSPDNKLLAYSVDYTGRNLFKLFFKDLSNGQMLRDSFDVGGAFAWANDSKTVLYDTKDKVTLRNDKIWRHVLGSDQKKDVLMYEEKDVTQYAYLSKSKSEQYFFINSAYTQTVEVHYLDANNPTGQFKSVRPREKDFFYSLEHWNDKFIIRTNWEAKNFRLMEAPVSDPRRENWKDVLPHKNDVLIDNFTVFKDHLVTEEHKGGLGQIHVIRWADKADHYIETGEPTYGCNLENNPEFDTKILRYVFNSMKTPATVIDYDMETRAKTVKKVAPVLGGFDTNNYETEFIWATARDGVKVPISIMYKKGLKRDGSAPCHLTGYGSYGYSYDPYFNRDKISLVDRGFVVGIAHIRGGMEMGYQWYENGKMLNKMKTFTDFIDCADHLVKEKYTSSDRLFAEGRSAGGLLMGAVTNLRPDLFKGIITGVPFVDVITTMSDASIPLTTGEYTEWGNPAIKEQYDYMKSYSPYDNLKQGNYPNILVLTSFADSQVQYWEPAKYVARVRDLKTDDNVLLLKTNMSGSHGGSSGRFERLKERALEYSWMMGLLGMTGEKMKQ
ncbi:MAG: S9 family peptidase [Haliscomenobacteraceae bacterium CHB4]|nr:Dipeptidyl aminopeptidase BI [Saprospiraceae bacterium]MCE7925715.1 S9 family peptidase [Haliscomenobacteraceae bacterium CHB4]